MRSLCLLAPALACATGCTIVYNTDDIRNRDAAVPIDATPPDAMPIDADPALLDVIAAEPAEIFEGTGGEGGRPVVVRVTGTSMIPGQTTVVVAFIDGAMEAITPDAFAVDYDMRNAAVALRIPVLPDVDEGATRTLRMTFSQPGAADDFVEVTVVGLDEGIFTAGNVAVSALDPLYSHIEITGAIHFTGTVPARLRATGDVVIAAAIDVDGSNLTAGVGGCDGGDTESAGGCPPGGGGAGPGSDLLDDGGGGGGGGYGDDGGGGGSGGAMGGSDTGNDMLVPLGSAGNRGNGGGGGGNGVLDLTIGGTGGGGGGVIEVVAGGDIVVTGTGAIAATGGPGAGNNGGGGGGSGGAILIRAGGAVMSSGAWLSAPGGSGSGSDGHLGGDGSVGRIRADAPMGNVAAMATEPSATRGPAWDPATPFLVSSADVTLTLRGQPGRALAVLDDDGDVIDDVMMSPTGSGMLLLEGLAQGNHRICAAYDSSSSSPQTEFDEALTCIELVYLASPE